MTVPVGSQCPRCRVSFYLPSGWDRCPLCSGILAEISAIPIAAVAPPLSVGASASEDFECRLCGQPVAERDAHCPRCGTIFDPPIEEATSSMRLLHQVDVGGEDEPILVEVWENEGEAEVCYVSCPICGNRVSCGNLACPRCGTMLDQLDPRSRDGDMPLVAPVEGGRGRRISGPGLPTLRVSAEHN